MEANNMDPDQTANIFCHENGICNLRLLHYVNALQTSFIMETKNMGLVRLLLRSSLIWVHIYTRKSTKVGLQMREQMTFGKFAIGAITCMFFFVYSL